MGLRRSTSFGPQYRRDDTIWQTNYLTPAGWNQVRMTAADMRAEIDGRERSLAQHGVHEGAADAIAKGLVAYARYRDAERQRERTMNTMRALGHGPDTLVRDVIRGDQS